ncbi:MAG: phosphatidate cytidylyltransferase [Acidimicrobiaceae bacterium]|nr:phosphatidate cytidylyltransferase [Acidimicrobiaceae bacterium]
MTGGFGTDLPHWTDPPTGEVSKLLPGEEGAEPEDLDGWRAANQETGVGWRDDAEDWNNIGEIDELGSEETRVGAMDPSRPDPGDLYSFEEDFERLGDERAGQHRMAGPEYGAADELDTANHATHSPRPPADRPGLRGRRTRGAAPDNAGASGGGRDLTSAVAVGLGLIILLVVGYAIGSKALLVLAAAVLLACSVEAFAMVQRRGFKPATLLGLAGVVGVVFAAYWRGTEALSIVTAVMFVATMLWYLLGVVDARPLANVSASLMIYLWIGFLGSFAALLLRAPHGRGLFLGAVLPTVAADVVAYMIGSRIGSRTLAPGVSPSKTVEGVVAGGLAALVVAAVIGHSVAPWGGFRHGLALGLVIAVVAPIGDLFESMVKRDLAVKDSGSALPGHGGLLDRFDSMLIVLPAVYYLASLLNLHV